MPLFNADDPAQWAAAYDVAGPDGSRLGFTRQARERIYGEGMRDFWGLIRALGVQTGQRILLVGCGFGWTCEALRDAGYGPVAGIDSSLYIQQRLTNTTPVGREARDAVLNETLMTAPSRTAVRDALGGDPFWTITEDVLPGLTDTECVQLLGPLNSVTDRNGFIGHWMTTGPGYMDLNWKTIQQWQTFIDANKGNNSRPHICVERGTSRRVI